MYMCTWCLWKKTHRKCSLKASTGTCSLKLQIVLCSSNNFIQFTVKKLWRRLVYWVTYLLSGPPGSKLDSCCCSLGRLEWFCPKLKYVCSNPDIKDEHLNKCFQQSEEWLPISRPVVMTTSILRTWEAWSLTSLGLWGAVLLRDLRSRIGLFWASMTTHDVLASWQNTVPQYPWRPSVQQRRAAFCSPFRLVQMASWALRLSSFAPSVPRSNPRLLEIPHDDFPFSSTDRTSRIPSQHLERTRRANILPDVTNLSFSKTSDSSPSPVWAGQQLLRNCEPFSWLPSPSMSFSRSTRGDNELTFETACRMFFLVTWW